MPLQEEHDNIEQHVSSIKGTWDYCNPHAHAQSSIKFELRIVYVAKSRLHRRVELLCNSIPVR